jgi:hypothetical protein
MIYTKLTYGFVAQSIDSETGDCVQMQFIPDGRIERQDDSGEPIGDDGSVELQNVEKECSLDMLQP